MEAFKIFGRIIIEGAEQAQSQLKALEEVVKDNKEAIRFAGTTITAFGAAVTGALALSTKAAIEQRESIARLSTSLKNVGIDYQKVVSDIEGVIDAQTKKTNYSDNQQIDALQQLVLITGDYLLSLEALPTVLDLAAAKNIDLSSAATLMGKAMIGSTEALMRYGIEIPKDASASKVLESVLAKVKGTAEATANPFVILKNKIGELAESVGTVILPVVTSLIDKIAGVVDWLKEWTEAHPELTRYVLIFAGTLGTLALGIGPLLIAIPHLVTGLRALTAVLLGANAAAGPVGWAIIAVSVALAAAMPKILGMTSAMKDMTGATADMNRELALTELQAKVSAHHFDILTKGGKVAAWQFRLIADEAGMTTQELAGLMGQADLLTSSLVAAGNTYIYLKEAVRQTTEATEDNTDAVEDNAAALQEQEEAQRDLSQAASDAIGFYMDRFQDAHNERMSALDDEYNATINTINGALAARLSSYDSEINALNKQIQAIDDAEEQKKDDITQAQLEAAVLYATTDKKRKAAQKELDDFLHKERIESQKDELRDRINTLRELEIAARNQANNDAQRARAAYETERKKLEDEYNANLGYLRDTKALYDIALTEQSDRYIADLAAFKTLLLDKLPAAQEFVDSLNAIYAQIRPPQTGGSGVCGGDYGTAPTVPAPTVQPSIPDLVSPWQDLQGTDIRLWQHGGLIREPTLLTRLRDMKAYAVAGEAGAERVGPVQNADIRIFLDSRVIAEALGQPLINIIRVKTGLKV